MIYTSELIEQIVTSEAARRALDYISPIYGNAERFLHIINAIGTQLDDIVGWADELWSEMFPHTATWSLRYWEQEYGLKTDESLGIEKRRALIMAKIAAHTQMNPARLQRIVESVAGVKARIVEDAGKNRFAVYLTGAASEREEVIREAIRRVKPAHLIFDLLYEMYSLMTVHYGGIGSLHIEYIAKQVV